MIKAIRKWLVNRIARKEVEALHRYRTAVDLILRWNVSLPESFDTASWIDEVGRDHIGWGGVEQFRADLRKAAEHRASKELKAARGRVRDLSALLTKAREDCRMAERQQSKLYARVLYYETALHTIAQWELPPPDGEGRTYEYRFGSQGAKAYMQGVASEALSDNPASVHVG